MNVLINISDEIYRHAKEGSEDSNDEWNAMRAIANGTPIPDNASNGDVIKAMFPNAELYKESDYVSLTIQDGVYLEDRDGSWWFAPYQKGGNE